MFFLILSEPETREPAEKSAGLSLVEDALSASFIGVGDLEEGERKRRKKYGNKREANCFCKNCELKYCKAAGFLWGWDHAEKAVFLV